MTQGVVLIAANKRSYAFFAYNLAMSIKYHNPNIKIALLHDHCIENLWKDDLAIFDELIPLNTEEMLYNGRFNAGKVKVEIYDKLPFDENIYLDVDALCFQDLQPMIDELSALGGDYYCRLYGTLNLDDASTHHFMQWADPNKIYDKYRLPKDKGLQCPNTSLQFIRKSEQTKKLFDMIQELFNDPIPQGELKTQWWLGTQPDELYTAAALCKLGMDADSKKEYIFFGDKFDPRPMHVLSNDYFLLSIYGKVNFTKGIYTEWYDKQVWRMHKLQGKTQRYKYSHIVNEREAQPVYKVRETLPDTEIKSGLIPISQSVLIDHRKLIQNYQSDIGYNIRVTNWFNCSFIRFQDKTYFCYRMEAQPFCTRMKIGICLLDDDLQPIQDTNVLLKLHSNLKGFAKGFHVEDPRLFIHNDELYLSYTDGYQMGQAKINPETREVEDSFYLDKVIRTRTEKNWTPFSVDGNLYYIYDLAKMQLLKMQDKLFSQDSMLEPVSWNFGELRGGCPPIKYGKNYILFFHSSTNITVRNTMGRQYHMGAMVIEGKYPYKPIAISKSPIMSGEKVSEYIQRLTNIIYVVFPSGVIKAESGYTISFGYNDYECRFVNVTERHLKENLISLVNEPLEEPQNEVIELPSTTDHATDSRHGEVAKKSRRRKAALQ